MTTPRVAIIVPCWNVAAYVTDALDSIAAQTMPDWECAVIDDGSEDGTYYEAVWDWRHAHRDRRFTYVSCVHEGLPASLTSGLFWAHAAPRVMFHAADDTMSPDYLEKCLAAMDTTGAPVAYTDVVEESATPGRWSPRYGSVPLSEQNTIPGCAVVDRWVIERAGGIPSGFPHGCEDWGLFVMAERAGCFTPTPPVHVEGTYYYHRKRPGTLSESIAPHMPDIRARIAALARGET